jgi:hypothetical protein
MPRLLHILNRPTDEFVETLLRDERNNPANVVEVVDLTAADADYAALVEKVFAADSVATW